MEVSDGERVYVHDNNARVYVQDGHWQHIIIIVTSSQHHSITANGCSSLYDCFAIALRMIRIIFLLFLLHKRVFAGMAPSTPPDLPENVSADAAHLSVIITTRALMSFVVSFLCHSFVQKKQVQLPQQLEVSWRSMIREPPP